MPTPPLVSVLFPTYNRDTLAIQGIESILMQDYPHIEVLVTDNGAGDALRDYIAALGDPRVQYHRNEANVGVARNHNRALALAKGDYVHVFSDDDLMRANCITRKLALFETTPGLALVHSLFTMIDGQGRVIRQRHWAEDYVPDFAETHATSRRFDGAAYLDILLFKRNVISMPSVMMPRAVTQAVGDFDPALSYLIDHDYWRRVATQGDVYYVAEPLLDYRIHGTNFILAMTDEDYVAENLRSLESFTARYPDVARAAGLADRDLSALAQASLAYQRPSR